MANFQQAVRWAQQGKKVSYVGSDNTYMVSENCRLTFRNKTSDDWAAHQHVTEHEALTNQWEIYEPNMNEFGDYKIGDEIIVTTPGGIYDTYQEMAKFMRLDNWVSGGVVEYGDIGNIVSINKHQYDNKILFGIRIKHQDYILESTAVKKCIPTLSEKVESSPWLGSSVRVEDIKEFIKNLDNHLRGTQGYSTFRAELVKLAGRDLI